MTAISNTPENKNFLSPLNFKFFLKRAPHINFFVQKINIPDVSLKSTNFPTPLVDIPLHGEHLDYGTLQLTFKVDEDLQNYLEIHNWIKALGSPEDFEGYGKLEEAGVTSGEGVYSDISLMILSSSKTANYEINFVDCHPVALTGATFTTADSDVNYVTASATFKYTYYDILKI